MHSIRKGARPDFETICEVWNAVWPHHHRGMHEMTRDQEILQPECRPVFWVAEEDGAMLGFAEVNRSVAAYHPRRWNFAVSVLPEHRRRGIGTSLYRTMLAFVEREGLMTAITRVNDEDSSSLRFIQELGYEEVKRDFESELDLETLDNDLLREMATSSAEIRSLSELDSPEFRRELHEVFETVRMDTPRVEPPTRLAFDQFQQLVLDDPEFLPEGTQIALLDRRIVGFSGIYRTEVEGQLFQWLTAVKREHRSKGIAKALKAKGAQWAIANGFRTVRTDNDTRNAPMLAINDRLGYRRLPGMITMSREFSAEGPQ